MMIKHMEEFIITNNRNDSKSTVFANSHWEAINKHCDNFINNRLGYSNKDYDSDVVFSVKVKQAIENNKEYKVTAMVRVEIKEI